jgi:ABC-type Zn2+ transport system substrate-binding protein/surface adhesin
VLVNDPEIQPGIRHILDTRKAIEQLRPVCLFTDVTARQNTIDTLTTDLRIRQVQLDLLGARLDPGNGYVALIDALVDEFQSCLAERTP